MEEQSKIKFLIDLFFALVIAGIIYICGKFLIRYLLPFVIASILAWWIQKPAEFTSKRFGIKTSTCAPILSCVVFFIVATVSVVAVLAIITVLRNAVKDLPYFLGYFSKIVDNLRLRLNDIFRNFSPEIYEQLSRIASEMIENFGTEITNAVSLGITDFAKKTPAFIFSFIVTLVASCYIAKDFKKLLNFLKELLGNKRFTKIKNIKEIFVMNIWKIIKGYIILMLITFAELWVGFLILKINYALVLALLISIIDLLPVFGTGTILIPWGIIEISLGNAKGFGILILYLIIVLIRNFLEPKIIGNQIGINPLFTLITMFAGLKIMGFWGLIIFPIIIIVTVKYYKNELQLEKGEI